LLKFDRYGAQLNPLRAAAQINKIAIIMKHKIIAYAFLPMALGLGIAASGQVSANGWFGGVSGATPEQVALRQQSMFDREAGFLGISSEELKNAWAEGKTFQQIATEKGITDEELKSRMKEYQLAQIKADLQALVDKNVITQSQMDKRLQYVTGQMENSGGKGNVNRRFFRGLHL
jgi:hypothetical protein